MNLARMSKRYLHGGPRGFVSREGVNVGAPERVGSVILGLALAAFGARKRGLLAAAVGLVGGLLVERGVSGTCPAYSAFGVSSS